MNSEPLGAAERSASSIPDALRDLPPRQKRELLAKLLQQQASGSGSSPPSLPRLQPDPEHDFKPFPLTDVQQAYWLGQSELFGLGKVATHLYF